MKLDKGAVLADRYEIIEQIGSGGMAIVYRAKDLKLDRDVTFKVLREEYNLDEEFLSRFNIEARSAASLSHPNIVNVYDVGSENDINFIVMEYIDGVTLKDLILKRAPFENEETLGVSIQIASALSHAHKNGIVHRDIKPQNILVTKTGVVKVTDFGIARGASSKTTTTTSNTMGSVHYFSPEQARGKYVDFRSDIYSLGISMYEMATGVLPYDGDAAVTVALKHLNEPVPDMVEINPEISISLEKVILKATSKSTAQRYPSADEMLIDLKRAITNESGDFINYEANGIDSPTIMLQDDELETIRENAGGAGYQQGKYDDDNIDKKTEKKIIIAAICTAVAIIALIVAIGSRFLFKSEDIVYQMIDLKGLTVAEAKEQLEEYNITIGDETKEASAIVEPGLIIRQNPESGTAMHEGDTVGVVVSSGIDKITVPSVIGKDLSEVYAEEAFSSGRLIVKEVREFSEEYEIGKIMEQSPNSGEEIPRGSEVIITISKGKNKTDATVPNVKGISESEAKKRLIDNKLKVGHVSQDYSNEYAVGLVFSQSIEGGESVEEGATVSIVISKGKDPDKEDDTEGPNPSETNNPTDVPTETNSPSNNVVKVEGVSILKPPLAEGASVNIKIEQTNADGTKATIYDDLLTAEDFPITLNVRGSGKVLIEVYADDSRYAQQTIDFDKN